MKIGALLTTVNHPQKQIWIKQVLDSIGSLNIPFAKQIVSVDYVFDDAYSQETINEYSNWAWSHVYYRSRVSTLIHELEKLQDCDYILHAEDDIVINKVPPADMMDALFSEMYNSQKCGILSPNLGGTMFDFEGGEAGDLHLIPQNIISRNSELIVFKRLPEKSHNFFFNLGVFFIRPDIFLECLKFIQANISGKQVETALTIAWFYSQMHLKYYKATYCDALILNNLHNLNKDTIAHNLDYQYLTILDENQGSSWYAGNQYTT
jgi:hypothetical protein